jgi:putative tryptophan/tyrosine transport system substrate-binding protein
MPSDQLKRRQFITLLGGAVSWPFAAHAQQPERMRRIGVLMQVGENDVDIQARVKVFQETLQQLGWTEGRDIRFDYRWGEAKADRARQFANELVKLSPDVIVGQGTISARALQQATNAIPVVFVQVTDPVGAGFVTSLAHPGANITGFEMYQPAMGAKWLEILKEIAPRVTRVAVMFNPESAPGRGIQFMRAIETASLSLSVKPAAFQIHNTAEIERAFDEVAREPNGGLLVPPDAATMVNSELIVRLAAQHQVPAIYTQPLFVTIGGLISYGVDTLELFRKTASYVDRILRGTKPSELPVEAPTKFELVINLKTAKALGLTVPQTLLVAADNVID